MERIIPFVHQIIQNYLTEDMLAVDATAGNGHDTLMLAKLCNNVIAFDIQKDAILSTSKRLEDASINHVKLRHASHADMEDYINKPIDVIMFNLGYLPGASHTIKTEKATTLQALKTALNKLNIDGICTLTVYVGHEGGVDEARAVERYLETLDPTIFDVLKYQMINKKNAPYNLIIKRRSL